MIWYSKKEYGKAIADYNKAISLDAKDGWTYNARARIWATCPDACFRDGKKAIESATRACELSKWKHALPIATLAAAYAESGDFLRAAEYQQRANNLYGNQNEKEKQEGERRLKLYQERKPLREHP